MGLNESLILNSPDRGRGREQQRRGAHVPRLSAHYTALTDHLSPARIEYVVKLWVLISTVVDTDMETLYKVRAGHPTQ